MTDKAGMTLVKFLAARLDEDERTNRSGFGLDSWHTMECGYDVIEARPEGGDCHCGLWRRMLREVEAKRAIVVDYAGSVEWITTDTQAGEGARGRMHGTRAAIAHLAAVYADHPDYREEWKPDA